MSLNTPLEKALHEIMTNEALTHWERTVAAITLMDAYYSERINKLSEMLMERTDELQRLKRLVGEEA